mmetsp:Transcript_30564/g.50604  ORF Transcript_30564/g.50604 Transcript_30564/m.50604 type:complete len:530 (-) Transcript_30564:70-1659(-)
MSSEMDDALPALVTRKARAALENVPFGTEVVVLTLSGALSPIHVGHIQCLHVAKQTVSAAGRRHVVLGLLAPSSASYLRAKLGSEALSLRERVALCETATNTSPWVGVLSWGIASSQNVSRQACRLLQCAFPDFEWVGVQVVGADFALKAMLHERADASNRFVCLPREGLTGEEAVMQTRLRSTDHFLVADPEAVRKVSSTAVRNMVRAGAWDELAASQMLHPGVCLRLQAMLQGLQHAQHEPPAQRRFIEVVACPHSAIKVARWTPSGLFGGVLKGWECLRNILRTQQSGSSIGTPARAAAVGREGMEYVYHAEVSAWLPKGISVENWRQQQQPINDDSTDKETVSGSVQANTKLIGISGASRAGKSTLARLLVERLASEGLRTTVVQQDSYFDVRCMDLSAFDGLGNWEAPEALDHVAFADAVHSNSSEGVDLVIAEGFQAFHDPSLVASMDLKIWLDIGKAAAHDRRMRTSHVPEQYFQDAIWPHHVKYRARVLTQDDNFIKIDTEKHPPSIVLGKVLPHVLALFN